MKHISVFVVALFTCVAMSLHAQVKNVPYAQSSLAKSAILHFKSLDGNRVNTTVGSDGPFVDGRKTGQAGLEWPKGSGKTAIYSAGLWLGGIHRPSGNIRVSNIDYTSEYQPGPLLEIFNTTTNDDAIPVSRATDSKYRIYKISRSDTLMPFSNPDYIEWPVELGAPYIDRNGNGVWEPGADIPKFYGEQQLWFVTNDASHRLDSLLSPGGPLGVEIRCLYHTIDGMVDAVAMRWTIINRSDADYDSTFAAIWADTDLGDANDDLPGSDSVRGMMYAYNADEFDGGMAGYGSPPPAVGYVYLSTPMRQGDVDDSAYTDRGWKIGYRNVPPSSSIAFLKGLPQLQDPPDGFTDYAPQAYDYMNGKAGTIHQYLYTNDGRRYTWYLSGDPITNTGDLPSNFPLGVYPPYDIRSIVSCGPFELAKGDTQEIVAAVVLAQGTDRLNSIVALRQKIDLLLSSFPNPPSRDPRISATVANEDTIAVVRVLADAREVARNTFTAILSEIQGSEKYRFDLLDDGINDNGIAGDSIYGATTRIPSQRLPLDVDIEAVAIADTLRWNGMARITTAAMELFGPFLVAEDLVNDGAANPGERIRYTVGVRNPNHFTIANIVIRHDNTFAPPQPIGTLDAEMSDTMRYIPPGGGKYFEIRVPEVIHQPEMAIQLAITDDSGNEWRKTVAIPVVPFVRKIADLSPVGRIDGEPRILITDSSLVKNHVYIIRGVDDTSNVNNVTLSVIDSTDGRTVLSDSPLPDSTGFHAINVLGEGFKIYKGMMEYQLKAKSWRFEPEADRWFTRGGQRKGNIFEGGIGLPHHFGVASSVPRGGHRKVTVVFSPMTGYDDLNSNGMYDLGEPYTVDTLSVGAQKAFVYRRFSTSAARTPMGTVWIPLAAYDDEPEGGERQLNIVLVNDKENPQWMPDPYIFATYSNLILVMDSEYDPAGTVYDPSKGGVDIGSGLTYPVANPLKIPVLWVLSLGVISGKQPFSAAGELCIEPTYPISSANGFAFNPTVVTGVEPRVAPADYSLSQNYPNPFNPSTTIEFALTSRSLVTLTIYNLLGQRVAALVDETKDPGMHRVVWNGQDASGRQLPSGVYFYSLQAGSFRTAKKMMLLK